MKTLLTLGDSILWGQGLREEEKCTRLLADAWRQAAGGEEVREVRYAHSGADVWDDNQSGVLAAINPFPPPFPGSFAVGDGAIALTRPSTPTTVPTGEIPDEEPYLLAQILAAGADLAAAPPDLVVLDMGINDTEIYNLVVPGKSTEALIRRASSLAPRVRFALSRVRGTFPRAKVLLTGYYAVVSERTEADELLQFSQRVLDAALRAAVPIPEPLQLALDAAFGHAFDDLVPGLARHSRAWQEATHEVLSQAVLEINAGLADPVAAFVDPDFRPEHALLAPESLLWPFVDGQPTDPMAGVRRDFCVRKGIVGFDALVVECASMGHPGPLGARRYADKMIAAARTLRLF
jgi:lysophospholipase L1-like esterase